MIKSVAEPDKKKSNFISHTDRMGSEKISSLLIKFSIPAITGTVINALYNVVDRIFVGRAVGNSGIAATAVSFPMMMMLMGFGMLIGFGTSTLISIELGKKNNKEAQSLFGQGVFLFFLLSLFFGLVVQLFLNKLLVFFGASPEVLPYARDYMRIILFGTFFHLVSFGVNGFIRAEGRPRIAMITMMIGAGLNIILDYILIFKYQMGMQGAAIATVAAQMISSVWVISYYLSSKSALKLRLKDMKLKVSSVSRVISMGSPQCIFHVLGSFVQALMNQQLYKYGGDMAISSMGVIFSISIFVVMPILGLSQAMQPIVGYNYGAAKYDRSLLAHSQSWKSISLYSIIAWISIILFAENMVGLFTNSSPDLISVGSRQLRVFMFMIPVVGYAIIGASFFQAVGKPGTAMLINMGRQVFILIPFMYGLPLFFGLEGVVAAMPVADFAAFVAALIYLKKERAVLKKRLINPVQKAF